MSKRSATGTVVDNRLSLLTKHEETLIGRYVRQLPDDRAPTTQQLAPINTALFEAGMDLSRTVKLLQDLSQPIVSTSKRMRLTGTEWSA